jgi:hypothetical protein
MAQDLLDHLAIIAVTAGYSKATISHPPRSSDVTDDETSVDDVSVAVLVSPHDIRREIWPPALDRCACPGQADIRLQQPAACAA